ncbi:hypothetical protein [uncultured Cedecea sp.]|uniref:hypothetical protein n=1 Tax=uncultured Cedecea sp. TaxID=988762 RepID=UPI002607A362|nr:hypothetical protein [uncultured Cedecea sp.]
MKTLSKGVMQHRKSLKNAALEFAKMVPIAGPHVQAAEQFFKVFSEINSQLCRERFDDYIMGIGEICEDEVEISREHFSALVKKLVLDDEDKKTEYYIRLTVSLARSCISDDEKFFYINALSDLTCLDIEYARKLYIMTNSSISGFKSATAAQVKFTSQKSGLNLRSLNKLITSGLIYEVNTTHPETSRIFNLTEELQSLLKYLFHREDFLPSILGLESKKHYDVLIMEGYEFYDEFCRTSIEEKLKSGGLSVRVEKNEEAMSQIIASFYIKTRTGENLDGEPYGVIEIFVHDDSKSFRNTELVNWQQFDPKIINLNGKDLLELTQAIDDSCAYILNRMTAST